ncbi:class I SAM-dependent methyltransferase [Actibacterium pelagium]|uniref:ATP synthase subunit beta n=1 Tax=Actibacterium pelagium TaxID=2029103 RepID=A0A917AL45_9RHOB|nr:SAM-dependent methyltransferase [Actibacterium pelagium]GGE59235.1 ATP synthase subunit beta [Actibacterium pelagium]
MTPLAEILSRRIAQTGPISVADYMAECLLHPEHGYYSTRDPFGAGGDFTTAPEISQMFGEMLGLCLAQTWMDQGSPKAFTLAEIGPGRGTLMSDILRIAKAVPGFVEAARVHLIEASPTLRKVQRQTLGDHPVTWLDDAQALPNDQPLFLVANEFFDALPIRQFQRDEKGWRERMVGLQDTTLAMGLSSPAPIALLDHRLADTQPGQIVETCPAAAPIVQAIGARIADNGGCAILIDYGDWHSLGDTLQALRDHQPEDPLANPGEADLTAHVDFEVLALADVSVNHTAMTPQGVLLERLGITPRAQQLAQKLAGDALESHIAAHRRLTHPQEMGNLFKTIALYPRDAPPPPGFDL